jgi:hypothetical protein
MEILKRDTILNKSKNERLIINMEILNVELQDKNQELKNEIDKLKEDNKELKNNILINKEYKNEIKSKIDELKESDNMKDLILDTVKFHHYALQNNLDVFGFYNQSELCKQLNWNNYVMDLNMLPSNVQKIYLHENLFLNFILSNDIVINKDTVISHKLVINKNIKELEFKFNYDKNMFHKRIDYNEIQINNFFNNLNIVKKIFPNANILANIYTDSKINIKLQQDNKKCFIQGVLNCYSYL